MSQSFATRGGYHRGNGGGRVSIQTPSRYPPFGQARQQSTNVPYTPRQNRRGNAYKSPHPAGFNANNTSSGRPTASGYGGGFNRSYSRAPVPENPALNPEWVEVEKDLHSDGQPPVAQLQTAQLPAVTESRLDSDVPLPFGSYGRAPGLPSALANQPAFGCPPTVFAASRPSLAAPNAGGGGADNLASPYQPLQLPEEVLVPPNTPFYAESVARQQQDCIDLLARELAGEAVGGGGLQSSNFRNPGLNSDWLRGVAMKSSLSPAAASFIPPTTPSAADTSTTANLTGGVENYGGSALRSTAPTGSLTDTETATALGVAPSKTGGDTKKMLEISVDEFKQLIEFNKTISDGYNKMLGIMDKIVGRVNN